MSSLRVYPERSEGSGQHLLPLESADQIPRCARDKLRIDIAVANTDWTVLACHCPRTQAYVDS